jgi:hypothetical protein
VREVKPKENTRDVSEATDFFTVEVLSLAGLVRYHVFFVIDLASRPVEVAGISR